MTSWLIYDVILAHDDVIMYLNDKSYEVQTPKIINSNKYLGSKFYAVTIKSHFSFIANHFSLWRRQVQFAIND